MLSRLRMPRSLFLCTTIGVALCLRASAQVADVAIEQSRQFARPPVAADGAAGAASADFPAFDSSSSADDAFGAQVIMKEQPRIKPFTAFAEIAAFFTNNVGLAKRARQEDKFLIASAGAAYSRPLGLSDASPSHFFFAAAAAAAAACCSVARSASIVATATRRSPFLAT